MARACQGLSAEGQGPANLFPPDSDQLSQRLPNCPPKTSRQASLTWRPCSQRGQQPGCFRPQSAKLDSHGGLSLMRSPGTSEPRWEPTAWSSRRGARQDWQAGPVGICMQVQAWNMSWNLSTENKTPRERSPQQTNGCGYSSSCCGLGAPHHVSGSL